jgi:acetyltransferase-like isoleucine patch superfamily enzyme
MKLRSLKRRSAWALLQKQGRISVGAHTYGTPIIKNFEHDSTPLTIGPYCSIASNVTFVLGGNHKMGCVSTYPFRIRWGLQGAGADGQPWSKGPISVGPDVWIGTGATILSGVDIGVGSVIGANSLVTKGCEPFTILGGNPAKPIGRRFDDETAARIVATRWWTWPEAVIRGAVDLLSDDQDLPSSLESLEALAIRVSGRLFNE